MSGPFNVGDVVVCVDAAPNPRRKNSTRRLKEGGLYRVSGNCSEKGVFIAGYRACDQHLGFGWRPERFRHLPKADEQFTEQMRALKPSRKQVKA